MKSVIYNPLASIHKSLEYYTTKFEKVAVPGENSLEERLLVRHFGYDLLFRKGNWKLEIGKLSLDRYFLIKHIESRSRVLNRE